MKSYRVNVTETISDEVCLNLFTDVDVRKANIADKSFVKATTEVTGQPVNSLCQRCLPEPLERQEKHRYGLYRHPGCAFTV